MAVATRYLATRPAVHAILLALGAATLLQQRGSLLSQAQLNGAGVAEMGGMPAPQERTLKV